MGVYTTSPVLFRHIGGGWGYPVNLDDRRDSAWEGNVPLPSNAVTMKLWHVDPEELYLVRFFPTDYLAVAGDFSFSNSVPVVGCAPYTKSSGDNPQPSHLQNRLEIDIRAVGLRPGRDVPWFYRYFRHSLQVKLNVMITVRNTVSAAAPTQQIKGG